MKRVFLWISAAAFAFGVTESAVLAQEHGGVEHVGMEHGGMEHSGTPAAAAPSDEDVRSAIRGYVEEEAGRAQGYFEVFDPEIEDIRQLSFVQVHERVGKTGDFYYSCADFKDADSGEMLDLDLDVEDQNGVLNVVDVRIHKVDGSPRYTYDENGSRIPVVQTPSPALLEEEALPFEEMDVEEEEEILEGNAVVEEQL